MRTQREEINSLRQEVTEIKGLLKELINNNDRTVNRNQTLEEFRNNYTHYR